MSRNRREQIRSSTRRELRLSLYRDALRKGDLTEITHLTRQRSPRRSFRTKPGSLDTPTKRIQNALIYTFHTLQKAEAT